MSEIIYKRRGNFWAGGVIESDLSVIQNESGFWFRYIGVRPKPFNVTPGTEPNEENWVNVGTLSTDINGIEGETFTEGGTLDNKKEFILDENTGIWYFWNGPFPKNVPANSNPTSTGGVSENAWKSLGAGGADVDISGLVVKEQNLADVPDKSLAIKNLNAMYKPDIDGVASFADLRTRVPAYIGERVMLKEYTVGGGTRPTGGGWFVGYKTASADDGGFVASSGGAYHWRREKELNDLTINDFGAVPDGVTDASPAFKRMYEFLFGTFARNLSGALSPTLEVKFTAGTYYMTPLDLRKYGVVVPNGAADAGQNPSGYYAAGQFRMSGPRCLFGKQISTTIISDKSTTPVFRINHRFWTVHGINWNGRQTIKQNSYNSDSNPTGTNMLIGATQGVFNDVASNKQPFLTNDCPAGCFAKVTCCNAQDTGAATFSYLDSLDSRFDEIYSQRTAGPVIQVGWSDPNNLFFGKWDHSTALKLTNCNFQWPMAPAFWIPRHGQGIMDNVWIEHGNVPFDINNGQWNINMLCIEDCTKNAIAYSRRLIIDTLSTPTGNSIDYKTSPTDPTWPSYPTNPDGSAITSKYSAYELGSARQEAYITDLDHPLKVRWYTGVIRGTNNTATPVWMNIGSFFTPAVGGIWEIEIICRNGYSSLGTPPLDLTADRTPAKTVITVQRGTGLSPAISMYHIGHTGVLEAQYQPQVFNNTLPALWVNLSSYCGEYVVNVKGTGITRLEGGECSLFNVNGNTITSSPNQTKIEARVSLHNGSAGFGAQGSVAAIKTTRATPANAPVDTSAPILYARMNINGQEVAMPVYAFIPRFTTNSPATLSVATGGTLTITTVVVDAVSYQWQLSTDSGVTWNNISGATAVVYTKTGVVAGDAGQYRLVARCNNGSGGAGSTTGNANSNVTTVTVTA